MKGFPEGLSMYAISTRALLQKRLWNGKPHYCKPITLFLQTASKDFLFIKKKQMTSNTGLLTDTD